MRCSPRNLSAYVDGALDPNGQRSVECHLLHCQACRTELADLQTFKSWLQGAPPPAPPEQLKHEIIGQVRFREARTQRLRPRVRFWQGAVVGGIAVLVIGGLSMLGADLTPGTNLTLGTNVLRSDGHGFSSTMEAIVSDHSQHVVLLETGVDDWADWQLAWGRRQ